MATVGRVVHGELDRRLGHVVGLVVDPDVDGVDQVREPGEVVGHRHEMPDQPPVSSLYCNRVFRMWHRFRSS